MLSRFSSLFTYVIVGLVVSAAATPMGPLDLGDGAKSLSHPGSPMKPYDKGKPYGDYKDKSYDGDKRKSYDNDRPKSYDDDMRKSYDGKKGDSYGQCSTGSQHCCNQVNRVSYYPIILSVNSSLMHCFRRMRVPRLTLSAFWDWARSSTSSSLRTNFGAQIVLPFWPGIRRAPINQSVVKTIRWLAFLPPSSFFLLLTYHITRTAL